MNTTDMNKLNLKFGRTLIARNGNNYRMACPTEDFWSLWKEHKEEIKKMGYSVFKRGGNFYIAYYDGSASGREAYEEQERENFQRVKRDLETTIWGYDGRAREKDIYEAIEIVKGAKTYSDFDSLNHLMHGVDDMIEEAQDSLFSWQLSEEK